MLLNSLNFPEMWSLFVLFQVLMKDITTPVPPEEMKKLVQKCLEKAARINYSQLMEYAQIKGEFIVLCSALLVHDIFFLT